MKTPCSRRKPEKGYVVVRAWLNSELFFESNMPLGHVSVEIFPNSKGEGSYVSFWPRGNKLNSSEYTIKEYKEGVFRTKNYDKLMLRRPPDRKIILSNLDVDKMLKNYQKKLSSELTWKETGSIFSIKQNTTKTNCAQVSYDLLREGGLASEMSRIARYLFGSLLLLFSAPMLGASLAACWGVLRYSQVVSKTFSDLAMWFADANTTDWFLMKSLCYCQSVMLNTPILSLLALPILYAGLRFCKTSQYKSSAILPPVAALFGITSAFGGAHIMLSSVRMPSLAALFIGMFGKAIMFMSYDMVMSISLFFVLSDIRIWINTPEKISGLTSVMLDANVQACNQENATVTSKIISFLNQNKVPILAVMTAIWRFNKRMPLSTIPSLLYSELEDVNHESPGL